jgi:hypothetical protein
LRIHGEVLKLGIDVGQTTVALRGGNERLEAPPEHRIAALPQTGVADVRFDRP